MAQFDSPISDLRSSNDAEPISGTYVTPDGILTPLFSPQLARATLWPDPPRFGQDSPSVVADVLKSIPTSLLNSAAGILTLPMQLHDLGEAAGEWLFRQTVHRLVKAGQTRDLSILSPTVPAPELGPKPKMMLDRLPTLPRANDVVEAVERNITGPLYQPQTVPGKFAKTIVEYLPGAFLGGGSIWGNALRYGILPGAASELAGQQFSGTPYETGARVGAGLLVGAGTAALSRPSVDSIAAMTSRGLTEDDIHAAEQLASKASGINLTFADAVRQTKGTSTGLDTLQQAIEATPRGGTILNDFYENNRSAIDRAAKLEFDKIGPVDQNPSMMGTKAAEAALQGLDSAYHRAIIEAQPFYDASGKQFLPNWSVRFFANTPSYLQASKDFMTSPLLQRDVGLLPQNSFAAIDAYRRYLEQMHQSARLAGDFRTADEVRVTLGRMDKVIENWAQKTNPASDYLTGRHLEEVALNQDFEPLNQGPLGQVARSRSTQDAVDALIPKRALPNGENEVANAVRFIAEQNPDIASKLVRLHVEQIFNDALREAIHQGQPFGATLRSMLVGNPQDAKNLVAAMTVLPNGGNNWAGFQKFLDVVEAADRYRPSGTQTGVVNTLKDKYSQWRVGKDIDQIARILTNPEAAKYFQELLRHSPASVAAQEIAARLVTLGNAGVNTANHN